MLSGTLDRHACLKPIVGHMGERLPAMFARCDQIFADEARERPTRTVSGTITDQVWATTGGFFTLPLLLPLLMTSGVDRVMFPVDCPFSPNAQGRAFLEALPLSPQDKAKAAQRSMPDLPAPRWPDYPAASSEAAASRQRRTKRRWALAGKAAMRTDKKVG